MTIQHDEEIARARFKAEICRHNARAFVCPNTRDVMNRIAETYDKLAAAWENLAEARVSGKVGRLV